MYVEVQDYPLKIFFAYFQICEEIQDYWLTVLRDV